jgi:hypothetical protein
MAGEDDTDSSYGYNYYYCKECDSVVWHLLAVTQIISDKSAQTNALLLQDARSKFKDNGQDND